MADSIRKEDWERFRAMGRVPPRIRDVVLGSWIRSRRDSRIETLTCAPSVAQQELGDIRDRNARLRTAAQAAIRRAGQQLNDGDAMVLLCDRRGVVMNAAGDARVLSRGEENHLHPGGAWDEAAIGTNAIGTALHLGKPVTISGVEHFCEAIQRWSCAAAPVRDPLSGAVIGAVDISGPAEQSLGPAAALSVSLALQIEEALRSASLHEHRQLIEALLTRRPSQAGDAVMLFDRYGQRVWSSAACDPAGTDPEDRSRAALRQLAPQGDGDARALAARLRDALPGAEVDLLGDRDAALGLVVTLRQPGRRPVRTPAPAVTLDQIAAGGPAMAAICARARRLVDSAIPLSIEGAAGSGKETLARALHAEGPLAALPLRIVDCGLLDADSLRRDLGAGRGLMRLADTGGTLCLDEVAETPAEVQPRLAQALAALTRQDGAPLQVMALSSVSLAERMDQGALRSELHFRVAGASLRLPGLAERPEQIPGLARQFADLGAGPRKDRTLRFTPAAMARLRAHDWPGNLRELRNLVAALSATSLSRLIDVADLPPEIAASATGPGRRETLRDRERAEILSAVEETGGNMTETARRLGISRSTLYLKLDQYGVPRARRS
ncbi:MAG: sigma-54-dependent Fis family transcriptional regulator [Pseudodonghicola sp.]